MLPLTPPPIRGAATLQIANVGRERGGGNAYAQWTSIPGNRRGAIAMGNSARMSDFTDGTSNTVTVWESGNGCWGSGDGQMGPKSLHVGGCHALLGDGTVRFLSKNMNTNVMRGLNSSGGTENLGDF